RERRGRRSERGHGGNGCTQRNGVAEDPVGLSPNRPPLLCASCAPVPSAPSGRLTEERTEMTEGTDAHREAEEQRTHEVVDDPISASLRLRCEPVPSVPSVGVTE